MVRKFARKYAPLSGAFGLVAFGAVLPARATNLLTNGSFESPSDSGVNNDYNLTKWILQGDGERSTFDNPPDGSWDLWLKTFEGAPNYSDTTIGGITFNGGATQVVNNITANTSYTLNDMTYFEAGAPASGANIDMALIWEDSSGNVIGTPALNTITSAQQTPLNAWTPFSVTGVAPAGAAKVNVLIGWTDGTVVSGESQSVLVDLADLEGAGIPPTISEWALAGSGDWNSNGNWTTGSIPNSIGVEADFLSAITANHTVYTDVPVTVGKMNFNNAFTYVIAGAGSLTLQTATGNAQVIVQTGTQEINLPLTIASNTVFNVSSGATLVIGNPMTINAGESVTTTGSGTVTYNSIINVGAGASIAFANSTHANALNLVSGASASVVTHSGSTPTILQLDNLSNSGLLDLTNNDMIVHNGNLATITSEIAQGFAGDWHGTTGIESSTAATSNNKALGVELATTSTFEGQSVTASKDVLVKYTYYGDSNLDGQVNATDYTAIDNGFNMHSTGWANGDFNYDGVVNGDDYTLIDNAFNTQGGVVIAAAPAQSLATDTAQIAGSSSAAVPEPATFSILGIAAAGLMLRRRRSEK